MIDDAWRARLEVAIVKSGLSKREISLKAERGHGYVHSVMSEGKTLSVENISRICEQIGVSVTVIIYGFKATAEDFELLAEIKRHPEIRGAILTMLRAKG